jgi:hypothetical protein
MVSTTQRARRVEYGELFIDVGMLDGWRAPNGAVKNKLLLGVRISIWIPPLFLKYHIAVDREVDW